MGTTNRLLSLEDEMVNDLKDKGINRSEFFTQAYAAFKKDEWKYDKGKQR